MIVAAADRQAADAAGAAADPDAGGGSTFAVALSADGTAPATHYGSSTAATDAILAVLDDVLASGVLPSIAFARCDAATGLLSATNVPSAVASVGQPWGWPDTLAATGLVPLDSSPDGD